MEIANCWFDAGEVEHIIDFSHWIWPVFTIRHDVAYHLCARGMVYAEFSDSVLVGLSSKRVPVLRFVTLFAAGAYATSWCAGIATL